MHRRLQYLTLMPVVAFVTWFTIVQTAAAQSGAPPIRCEAYNVLEKVIYNFVGQVRGISALVPFIFLGLLSALAVLVIFRATRSYLLTAILYMGGIGILVALAPDLLPIVFGSNPCA